MKEEEPANGKKSEDDGIEKENLAILEKIRKNQRQDHLNVSVNLVHVCFTLSVYCVKFWSSPCIYFFCPCVFDLCFYHCCICKVATVLFLHQKKKKKVGVEQMWIFCQPGTQSNSWIV